MSKMKVLLLFLFFPLVCSCYYTKPSQFSTFSAGIVPFHEQATDTLCQAASLYMVADYHAQNVGWYDASFIESTELATQSNIYNELLITGGVTWTPYSYAGAPTSYSSFLYWHLNIYNNNTTELLTYTGGDAALNWQLQNFQYGGGPVIVLFQLYDEEGNISQHAVVEYAIQYDNYNKRVNLVYYHDPYAGAERKNLKDEWLANSYLSGGFWLTMNIYNVYKGEKSAYTVE